MNLLLRTTRQTDDYTQSVLMVVDTRLYTIERPWIHTPEHRGGKNGESCVPAGRYTLVPHDSRKFGRTWALVNPDLDVFHFGGQPGRFAILLHAANYAHELQGCLAPGMEAGEGFVMQSQKAMNVLRRILPWESHTLDITRHRGTY